jgi:hypothetical protein
VRRTNLRRVGKKGGETKRLDGLWRDAVFARYGSACKAEGCGGMRCGGGLQAHHIYGKGAHPRLRYDIENGLPVCGGHHRFFIHGSSSSPDRAAAVQAMMLRVCGRPRLDRLSLRAAVRGKTRQDKKAIALFLEAELRKSERRLSPAE